MIMNVQFSRLTDEEIHQSIMTRGHRTATGRSTENGADKKSPVTESTDKATYSDTRVQTLHMQRNCLINLLRGPELQL